MVLFVGSFCFLLLVISELKWAQCEPKKFAKEVKDIYEFALSHTSSKQPYFARNRTIKSSELNAKDAVKIWMLVRHGSRTGTKKESNEFKAFENGLRVEIIRNLENVEQCPLSKTTWKSLKTWKWNPEFDANREITKSGKSELKKIGEKLKSRFPKLFKGPFNKSNFYVVCTDEPRTRVSAAAFVDAIVGSKMRDNVLSVSNEEENKIIRAYTYPPYYDLYNQRKENKNDSLLTQFYETDTFKQVVEDFNSRLLFKDEDYRTKLNRVNKIHSLCQFEGTWEPKGKSVWCSLFTKDELLILEYSKDLYRFIDCSPFGGEVNMKAHCSSVRNMINYLSTPSGPKVTAYFTHSAGLLLHMTAMGVFADIEELTVDYSKEGRKDRKWNISILDPMGANFVAVLYKNNQVKFFLNDKVQQLSGCNGGLCDVASLAARALQCY